MIDTGVNLNKNPDGRFCCLSRVFSVVCENDALKQNIQTITNNRQPANRIIQMQYDYAH